MNERGEADTDYQLTSRQREDALWDSTERRTDTASSLEGKASREAVNVRMGIDKGPAKPPREAVADIPRMATTKPKTPVASKGIRQHHARRPRM
jgi:hypothetical protein